MPFTLAHPAIVLPLKQSKRFSLTALVAGSMVPDLEFFFQMREVENIGHKWTGILLFDFPVALLCCYVFHNLLRDAFIMHLPAMFRNRAKSLLSFNWNKHVEANKWMLVYSLLIGIATHLIWDGFTHHDGMFVTLLPLLSVKVSISNVAIPVYFLLQMVFSLFGLLTVGYVLLSYPQQQTEKQSAASKWYWPLFIFLFLLILIVRVAFWPQYNSFWGLVMATMGAFCYSWLLVSLPFKNVFIKK